jgi:hypothetical protein
LPALGISWSQDVSISHDFLGQDVQDCFYAHPKKSLTREQSISTDLYVKKRLKNLENILQNSCQCTRLSKKYQRLKRNLMCISKNVNCWSKMLRCLRFTKWSQVLPQDVSISHDFLAQDPPVLHAHPKKCSTRVVHSCIFLGWPHELLVPHANTQALVLRKKVMHYGHILKSVQVKNEKKKVV